MNILTKIRSWFNNMFAKEDIEKALGIQVVTSPEMQAQQELWRQLVQGKAPWNVLRDNPIPSLMLASTLCSEIANNITLKAEAEITGSPRADWLNIQHNKIFNNLNFYVQKLLYNGVMIIKPTVDIDKMELKPELFENNMFYQLDEKGDDIVFPYKKTKDDKYYTLLERCTYDNDSYTISYSVWKSDKEDLLGKQIELITCGINEWMELSKRLNGTNAIVFEKVKRRWHVPFEMPLINHIDCTLDKGVAIFSKCVDDFKKADYHEENTDHEFKAGRLRQNVSSDMLKKDATGKYMIDDDVYQVFEGTGMPKDGFVNTYSPELREQPLTARENRIYRRIELKSGIQYGVISDPQSKDKTAKEVVSGEKRGYVTYSSIQTKALEPALREYVEVCNEMADRYYLATQGTYNVQYWWSDNVLVTDEEIEEMFDKELTRMLKLQQIGAVGVEEVKAFFIENSNYFSKLTPKMIEEARKTLPDVMSDE